MNRIFSTIVTVQTARIQHNRLGRISSNTDLVLSFPNFLASLSPAELGELLAHSEKTTNLIHAAYIKACAKGVVVNEQSNGEGDTT